MKRRNAVLTAALALLAALVAFGTVAHFSGEAHVTNVITTGNIAITLNDTLDGRDAKEVDGVWLATISGVMPGKEVEKIVSVTNTGSGDAWVRIGLEKAINLAEGKAGEVDTNLISIQFDDSKWIAGEDGYYYYNEPLKPGITTDDLFKSVIFSPDMGNLYQGSTATIKVEAQAVQWKNNGDTVMDAEGWPLGQLNPAPET